MSLCHYKFYYYNIHLESINIVRNVLPGSCSWWEGGGFCLIRSMLELISGSWIRRYCIKQTNTIWNDLFSNYCFCFFQIIVLVLKDLFAVIFPSYFQSYFQFFSKMETTLPKSITAQPMKFSATDFFSNCDQIRSFLRIWSYLLKKPIMENFILCAVNNGKIALSTFFFLFLRIFLFYVWLKHRIYLW